MKILQVAPLFESVPPKYYGGTERIVSYLTEELVRMGHQVTLFASGDSLSEAQLEPMCHRSLRLDKQCVDQLAHHVLMVERLAQWAHEFEIIHSHIDYLPFTVLRRCPVPAVTTLHGRLDIPDLQNLYREFADMAVVSVSDAQRQPLPALDWRGTVYHGLPGDLYEFHEESGEYLAFLGRISPEKRVDAAIEIARRTGMPLRIAAKVDEVDHDYFDSIVKPLLALPNIDYVGEIGEAEKGRFLGEARALLFPIDWPEPFGLVMIEAMACGTPVIARSRGSVPEVMIHGETGFIVEDVEDAVRAVERIGSISRRRCREVFEQRFTARRMAQDYLAVYGELRRRQPGTMEASDR